MMMVMMIYGSTGNPNGLQMSIVSSSWACAGVLRCTNLESIQVQNPIAVSPSELYSHEVNGSLSKYTAQLQLFLETSLLLVETPRI